MWAAPRPLYLWGLLPAYMSFLQWFYYSVFFLLFIFRYSSLSPQQIKRMPIPKLAAADCLIVTWVTNRQKHLCFVKEELYPSWSVEVVAEWYWVKVSSKVSLSVISASLFTSRKMLTVLSVSTALLSSSGSDKNCSCFVSEHQSSCSQGVYPLSL